MGQIFNFKAWDIKNSIMYDSIYELYFENGSLKEVVFSKTYVDGEEDILWEFARYVNLRPFVCTCTNGVDIYAGDIVEFTAFSTTVRGVVEWNEDDGLPCYCIVDADGSGAIWAFIYDDLKIIGNVYENPEYLRGN